MEIKKLQKFRPLKGKGEKEDEWDRSCLALIVLFVLIAFVLIVIFTVFFKIFLGMMKNDY